MENDIGLFDPFSPSPAGELEPNSGEQSKQAILSELNGVLYLQSLDAGLPASLNGKKVLPGTPIPLKEGDNLKLGSVTPIRIALGNMGCSATKRNAPSTAKSVHFPDQSPRVFELTPDMHGSEHKTLKGRKQTPVLFKPGKVESPGKILSSAAARYHERRDNFVTKKSNLVVSKQTPLQTRRNINVKPASAIPKPSKPMQNSAAVPRSEPRGKRVPVKPLTKQTAAKRVPRSVVTTAGKTATPLPAGLHNRMQGVTPIKSNVKSTRPRFQAGSVRSASKSESRVKFALNDRKPLWHSAKASRSASSVRSSQSIDQFMPRSPDDMSLANVSEWVDHSESSLTDTSSNDMFTLEDSSSELNKGLSIPEEVLTDEEAAPEKAATPEAAPLAPGRKLKRISSEEIVTDVAAAATPASQETAPDGSGRKSRRNSSVKDRGPVHFTSPPLKSIEYKRSSFTPRTPVVVEEPELEEQTKHEEPKPVRRKSRVSSVPRTPVVVEEVEPVAEEVPKRSSAQKPGRKSLKRVSAVPPTLDETYELIEDTSPAQPGPSDQVTFTPDPFAKAPAIFSPTEKSVRKPKSRYANFKKSSEPATPNPFSDAPAVASPQQTRKQPVQYSNFRSGSGEPFTPDPFSEAPALFSPEQKKGRRVRTQPAEPSTPNPFAEAPAVFSPPQKIAKPKAQYSKFRRATDEPATPNPFSEKPGVFSPEQKRGKEPQAQTTEPPTPNPFAEMPTIASPAPKSSKPKTQYSRFRSAGQEPATPDPFSEKPGVFSPEQKRGKESQAQTTEPPTPNPFAEMPAIASPAPKSSKPKTQYSRFRSAGQEPATPDPFSETPGVFSPEQKRGKESQAQTTEPPTPNPFAEVPAIASPIQKSSKPKTQPGVFSPPEKKVTSSAQKATPKPFAESPKIFLPGDKTLKIALVPLPKRVLEIMSPPRSATRSFEQAMSPLANPRVTPVGAAPKSAERILSPKQKTAATPNSPLKSPSKTPLAATSAFRKEKSAKRLTGVTFAVTESQRGEEGFTSPVRESAKRNPVPTRLQTTPANLAHRFRPSVGVSPGQRGSLRKVMMKRMFEKSKTDETEPKKTVVPKRKSTQMMTPDPVAMRRTFGLKKNPRPKSSSPVLSPTRLPRLFVEKKKKERQSVSTVLEPVAMRRMFGQKRHQAKAVPEPDRGIMVRMFDDAASSRVNKRADKPTEPIVSPRPMKQLFAARSQEGLISPVGMRRIFEEEKQKVQKTPILEGGLNLSQVFVDNEPVEEPLESSVKKNARFAEPVEQPTPPRMAKPQPSPPGKLRRAIKGETSKSAEKEPVAPVEASAKKAQRGRRRKIEVEETPVKETSPAKPASRGRGRRTPAEKPVENESEVSAPPSSKRTRKATVVEAVEEAPKAPPKGRRKKAEPEPVPQELTPLKEASPPPKPTRRGRAAKTEKEEVPVAEPVTQKRGRQPVDVEKEQLEAPVETKRRRGRAAAKVEPPVEEAVVPKAGRGRKNAATPVEAQETVEPPAEQTPAPRSLRGRKVAAAPVEVQEPVEPVRGRRAAAKKAPEELPAEAPPALPRKSTIRVTRAMNRKTAEAESTKKGKRAATK